MNQDDYVTNVKHYKANEKVKRIDFRKNYHILEGRYKLP